MVAVDVERQSTIALEVVGDFAARPVPRQSSERQQLWWQAAVDDGLERINADSEIV